MSQKPTLTAEEQRLNDLWEEHLRTEFTLHSADEAIATMAPNPLVNQVPVFLGSRELCDQLLNFLRLALMRDQSCIIGLDNH